MKIGCGAGHGGNDPGAVSGGNNEAALNRIMNAAMVSVGRECGQTMLDATVEKGYPYNINEPVNICNSNRVDLAIQNHFNAGGGTGVEVLYYSGNATTQAMAAKISAAIASAYGITNRGAKGRTNLGFINNTSMNSLIVEWGFVDAPGDADVPKIKADPSKGVRAFFNALGIGGGVTSTPAEDNSGGTTSGSYAEPSALLQKGSIGDGVRWVQAMLNAKSGAGLAVDGDFGPLTDTAVRNFQRNKGLGVDGCVGPLTRAALLCPYNEPGTNLQKGSTGDGARWVQWYLARKGYVLNVDGDFGPITQSAVIAFQKSRGLAQDGIVGPLTRNKLKNS